MLEELVFPLTGFLFRLEPAFGLLLGLARPVLVSALNVECSVQWILAN